MDAVQSVSHTDDPNCLPVNGHQQTARKTQACVHITEQPLEYNASILKTMPANTEDILRVVVHKS